MDLLTFKHIQNKVHVSSQDLYALHACYGPDGDKLVTVHLRHEVQVLGQIFPVASNNKSQKWMHGPYKYFKTTWKPVHAHFKCIPFV